MFIRETQKIDPKTHKKYVSYQLVESVRTELGPRQKILLTIGSDIVLTPAERKELANRIEELHKGILSLVPCSSHIEGLAQHFVRLLRKHSLEKEVSNSRPQENQISDFHTIDINTVRHTSVRTIGPEFVAFSMYKELDFDSIFTQLRLTKKQKAAAAASIVGRAIYPSSERALHSYLQSRSGLGEFLGENISKVSLDSLYSITDNLYSNKRKLEKYLRNRAKSLFNLQETIILYDITNTFFEGSCKNHPKAHRGKSKEMRYDCPLLALGVILDAEGFPKHSEIFEGNVNERATLQEMIQRLARENDKKPIIVLDSGIATKDNVEWLKQEGYFYIVMMKKKERPPAEQCKDVIIRDDNKQFVSASLKYNEETDDHILWCYSELRLKKEQDIKKHKANALEEALVKLKRGLVRKGGIKSLEKVHQKIGRLREKYCRLAQHYSILVDPSECGIIAKDITWSCDEMKADRSFGGTYTLRTNVKDLSAKMIWEIYVMLNEAESCFRCLKSEAGLRPNWHKREDRVESHMFISILSYHLIVAIRKRLKDAGINDSWETVRAKLTSHVIVSTTFQTKEEEMVYLKKASEPDSDQRIIYRALGLSFQPLKPEKMLIKKDVVSKT